MRADRDPESRARSTASRMDAASPACPPQATLALEMTANIASSSAVGHARDRLAEVGVEVDRGHAPTVSPRPRPAARHRTTPGGAGSARCRTQADPSGPPWPARKSAQLHVGASIQPEFGLCCGATARDTVDAWPARDRGVPRVRAALRRHDRARRALRVRRRLRARRRRHTAVPRRPRRPDPPALRVRRPHGRGDRPAPDAAPAAHRRAPGRRCPDHPPVRRRDPAGLAAAGDRARAGAGRPRPRRACRSPAAPRSACASATPARGSDGCPRR